MFEWILLLIGIGGFGAAGYWDLKTTEFPDWLPYSIIILSLIAHGTMSFLMNDFNIIFSSVKIGLAFLGLGYLLYFLKQWGDGDAWLLGALGFLFPFNWFIGMQTVMFPITLIVNFFVIAFVYLIIYSIAIGVPKKEIRREFRESLRKDGKRISLITFAFIVLVIASIILVGPYAYSLSYIPALILFLLIFLRYAMVIEKMAFKRKIKAKDLKEGDVPVDGKWKVLKKEELKKLHERGGEIWIKEGIRLAPVFIITLLVSIFIGNIMLLFI